MKTNLSNISKQQKALDDEKRKRYTVLADFDKEGM
jgi:hypothetical protein